MTAEPTFVPMKDGEKLAVWDDGGDGAPVVFVHGFPETHRCWDDVLEHLAALRGRCRFIRYDLRGFGASSKRGEGSWQEMLDDHLHLVSVLALPPYHLVGHDWGGATALHVARYSPERLASLVVMNTNYWRTDLKGMWHLFFLNAPIVTPLLFELAPDRIFQAFLVATFRHPPDIHSEKSRAYRRMFHQKDTVRFWIRMYRKMAKSLVRQAAPAALKPRLETTRLSPRRPSANAFRTRTTLIWGKDDTFNPAWIAEDMLARLRKYDDRAALEMVDDAGHFVAEEQPKRVAELLAAHLESSSQGPPRVH
jgi:pimeloyl-ACP methyl ester carboxylesterase